MGQNDNQIPFAIEPLLRLTVLFATVGLSFAVNILLKIYCVYLLLLEDPLSLNLFLRFTVLFATVGLSSALNILLKIYCAQCRC